MHVRLLENKSQFQRALARRKAALKERPIHIQLRGGDLSETEMKSLKSDIEDMVHAELEHSLSRRSEELEISIAVSLTGLPDEERILIESKIRKMVTARTPKARKGLDVSVRDSFGPPPGDILFLNSINPLPPPTAALHPNLWHRGCTVRRSGRWEQLQFRPEAHDRWAHYFHQLAKTD